MIKKTLRAGNQHRNFEILSWGVRTLKAVPGAIPGHRRGLFAAALIFRGEIIDRASTVFVSLDQSTECHMLQFASNVYFEHPRATGAGLLILGLPSLCNCADQPNADVRFVDSGPCGWIAELYALEEIPNGAEISCRHRSGA